MRKFTPDSNIVVVDVIIKMKDLWQSQFSEYSFGQVDIMKTEMNTCKNPKVT